MVSMVEARKAVGVMTIGQSGRVKNGRVGNEADASGLEVSPPGEPPDSRAQRRQRRRAKHVDHAINVKLVACVAPCVRVRPTKKSPDPITLVGRVRFYGKRKPHRFPSRDFVVILSGRTIAENERALKALLDAWYDVGIPFGKDHEKIKVPRVPVLNRVLVFITTALGG